MSTTARPRQAPRRRDPGFDPAAGRADTRDEQYDLLTAALIGLAVGAGATLLLRRGPSGRRPIGPIAKGVGRGARWAGSQSLEGARWVADRGEDLWDRIPHEAMAKNVRGYLEDAREAINDTVEREMRDLRKAVRRRRKQLGL